MAMPKKPEEEKKKSITINFEEDLLELMDKYKIKNKSKFINSLLEEYFNGIKK